MEKTWKKKKFYLQKKNPSEICHHCHCPCSLICHRHSCCSWWLLWLVVVVVSVVVVMVKRVVVDG